MGFLWLTGEVGTGKTTLCRTLLDKLEDRARTVYVINPSLSGVERLACILEDLGLACPGGATKKALLDQRRPGGLKRIAIHTEPMVRNNTKHPVVSSECLGNPADHGLVRQHLRSGKRSTQRPVSGCRPAVHNTSSL